MSREMPHYNPVDFGIKIVTESSDADISHLQNYYTDVINANNSMPGRHIDWTKPSPEKFMRDAIDERRMLVVQHRGELGLPPSKCYIWASVIMNSDPGFGKLAVNADLLGGGFGRRVAIPWLRRFGREVLGAHELFFDALPNLAKYYASVDAEKIGKKDFVSKTAGRVVTLFDYRLSTQSATDLL
jgi:hypothetical protein